MKKYLICFCLIIFGTTLTKVLIITTSYNRPDFIELQFQSFTHFLNDDYEYVVFNDAPENSIVKKEIEDTCRRLGIQCIRIPANIHNKPNRQSAGDRHIEGLQFALNTIGYDYNGIVTIIDSDVFMLKSFSIEKYLEDHDIAGKIEARLNLNTRVRYFSPVLIFMNMQTLPNKKTISFEGGYIEGLACDVGAHTYYYLKNNPKIKTQFFTMMRCLNIGFQGNDLVKKPGHCSTCSNSTCLSCTWNLMDQGFDDHTISFIQTCPDDNIEFILNHTFLHYRCGSNWNNQSSEYHAIKTQTLRTLLNGLFLEKN